MSELNSSVFPSYLEKTAQTFVQLNSSVIDLIDSAPQIVMCSENGYLYEIKTQKIIRRLNLNETGKEICYAFFVENEKPLLYYIVLTLKNNLFVIKRLDSCMEIASVYEEVKSYEIDDFMLLGYPQINITNQNSNKSSVIYFPTDHTKIFGDELDYVRNFNTTIQSLAGKLQIICRHVDELSNEYYSLKKLCQVITNREDFNFLQVDCVDFPLPALNYAAKISILATWFKIIGEKFIFGLNIINDGKEAIFDILVRLLGKAYKDYSYRFFSYSNCNSYNEKNPFFCCEKIASFINPGEKITIVVAASINIFDFPFGANIQIPCYLFSARLKDFLLEKTFELNISDWMNSSSKFFTSLNSSCSVEDLQSIKAAKLETKVKIEMKNIDIGMFENILVNSLKFFKVENLEFKLYYSISNYLREVFIAFQPFSTNENFLKVNLYTSVEAEIYFLMNLFNEFLAENTAVILQEN